MGCAPSDTDCWFDGRESPYHEVTLASFSIETTEVTVDAYGDCLLDGTCATPATAAGCNWGVVGNELHPINCITWSDALDYCTWVGRRLPTEAEWEFAARGTDARLYPWGNTPPTCALTVMGSPTGCGTGGTWAVGSKPLGASFFGALDMAGNVQEWVADWYDAGWYAQSPSSNPTGPATGSQRVIRGSMWQASSTVGFRTSMRGATSFSSYSSIGFRCAMDGP